MISGYKAFNLDMTNRYGDKFEIGKYYSIDGDLRYGNAGNGYHMCKNLVDVFRFYEYSQSVVAKVRGYGDYILRDNPNIGYYDMYAVESFIIDEILSKDEVFNKIYNSNIVDIKKFVQNNHLSDDEISALIAKYRNDYSFLYHLMYYQLNYKDIYYTRDEKMVEKVKTLYLN